MTIRRPLVIVALGAVLMLRPIACGADDAASGGVQPRPGDPAPHVGGNPDDDDPTSDALERWRQDDHEEYQDARRDRRQRRELEKQLDERFRDDAPTEPPAEKH